jgi:predicted dehydrogenase
VASDPRCEVVACCDTSEAALARFQRELQLPDGHCFTDYEAFISAQPMDAVFVGTPIPAHADQTVAALEAGVNVLSEVTASDTLEGCARIVEAARRTGRVYMLAENCCYWEFVKEWRELVQAGRLGRVFYSECEYLHPLPALLLAASTGQYLWRANRPPLHYCSHSLGPVLEITGDRITRALGLGNTHFVWPEHRVPGAIDIQVALFQTERDAVIKLLRTSIAPHEPPMHYYMLQGTRGFLETDRKGPLMERRFFQSGLPAEASAEAGMERPEELPIRFSDDTLPEQAKAGGHGTAEYGVLQDFLRALETGEEPSLDAVRAMDITVPGLIAHASAMRGGVWMDVPSFG